MRPRKTFQFVLAISLFLPVINASAAKECAGLTNILKGKASEIPMWKAILALAGSDTESAECSSLTSVAGMLVNRDRTSGRRLEDKKPFNIIQAQANLDKALADPSIKSRLEKLKQQVTDEQIRAYLEAAVFDEDGYYGARDLRIQQLMENLK